MISLVGRAPLGPWRLASTAALVGLAAMVIVGGLLTADSLMLYGWDFRVQYYLGAMHIRDGADLYPALDEVTRQPRTEYLYPPLTAVAAVAVLPFTVLSEDAAVVFAVLVSLAAVLGALAVAGVRDARCYVAVVASAPFWNIAETANLNAPLALGLALLWRYRDRSWPPAVALGLGLSAKFFVWPMLVWLVATRRYRTASYALAIAIAATTAAWAVVGFEDLTRYPSVLERIEGVWAGESYSIVGMAAALDLDTLVGRLAAVLVGGALLLACTVLARRRDERRSFTCAVAAALALTPIVWVHYVVLLLVPLALARPRFSAAWLLPMILWMSPRLGNGDGVEPFILAAVAVVMLVVMLGRPRTAPAVAEAA